MAKTSYLTNCFLYSVQGSKSNRGEALKWKLREELGGKNQPAEIIEKEMLMEKITRNKTKQNEASKDSDFIDLNRLLTMWNCNYLASSWDLVQGIITTKLRRLFSGAEHIDFAVLQHLAKQLTMSFKCSLTKHINKHKTFKKTKITS